MPVAPFTTADPNAYIALGMQTGLGAPQVTATKLRFVKYLAGNAFNIVPAVVDLREGGDGLDFGVTYKHRESVSGTLVFNVRPEIAGQFLQLLPGGATWAGASLPAITTFHDNHASHPYATMQIQHPGSSIVQLFSDVRFDGFTLDAVDGAPLKISAPFVAITFGASAAALTPTYYNVASPGSDDFWIFETNPSIALDGQADATIDHWTLSLKLGTEELGAQGVMLDDIAVLNRDWDFSAERRYQSPSMWQKIAYGGVANVAPTFTVPTGAFMANYIYAAAGASRALRVDCGLLSYRYDNLTELDPDGKTVKESISAKPLHTATSGVTITLSNAHASSYGP